MPLPTASLTHESLIDFLSNAKLVPYGRIYARRVTGRVSKVSQSRKYP